jgi:hypothetical protein
VGEGAPIDALWRSVSTSRINRQNVERKAPWPMSKVRRESERTLAELIAAIEAMTDARWNGTVTTRGRKPLGARLGAILGGPTGPYRHDDAHLPTLLGYLDEAERGAEVRPARRGRSATPAT